MRTLGSCSICGHGASCDLLYFPVRQASNALMPRGEERRGEERRGEERRGEEAYRDRQVIIISTSNQYILSVQS